LLAKVVCQSQVFQLTHRLREQARSHIGLHLKSGSALKQQLNL
jgi:hypothetical protein